MHVVTTLGCFTWNLGHQDARRAADDRARGGKGSRAPCGRYLRLARGPTVPSSPRGPRDGRVDPVASTSSPTPPSMAAVRVVLPRQVERCRCRGAGRAPKWSALRPGREWGVSERRPAHYFPWRRGEDGVPADRATSASPRPRCSRHPHHKRPRGSGLGDTSHGLAVRSQHRSAGGRAWICSRVPGTQPRRRSGRLEVSRGTAARETPRATCSVSRPAAVTGRQAVRSPGRSSTVAGE